MPPTAHPGRALVAATAAATVVLSISYGELGLFFFPIIFAATFVIAAVAGLPLYCVALRTGEVGWLTAMLAGLAISQIQPLLDPPTPGEGVLVYPAWLALAGIAGGLVFWWCARSEGTEP
ncbi:MAG: hypothetical protein EOP61_17860 [Sphingomonadales bacterium]|nr:MAG: hypothetical protein EOP61_17860 [Sphingomonadales bacterium]